MVTEKARQRRQTRGLPILVLLIAGPLPWACREKGRPDPSIQMAISHESEDVPTPAAEQNAPAGSARDQNTTLAQPVPTLLEVPPEVARAFSGVQLAWRDKSNGQEGVLDVHLGEAAKLPGSNLEVRAEVYLPAFSMTGQAITSTGIQEENPAARVTVAENGSQLFGGWLFLRFPDVHPFQHSRYAVRLVGGIRKAAK
ncbi:MAG TPA: DUF2155 domain-containing protein [Thermoanaerobaculia bacterium]|nr:DUF2155 domain-containing protein [Thermoanaerobaculia bacterium]